jgi:subtilisin
MDKRENAQNARSGTQESGAQENVVEKGARQFLIAPRRGSAAARVGLQPMSAGAMRGLVGGIPGVEVVKVLKPSKVVTTLSTGPNEATEVFVVRMDRNRAELLQQSAPPHIIIEEDRYLDYGGLVQPLHKTPEFNPLKSTAGINEQLIRFRVVNQKGEPLANTKVVLTGDAFPAEGVTDNKGEVALKLFSLPGGSFNK